MGYIITSSASTFRPEIQALRAIAVTLVVVYHLWPASLAGGYIGVDVFFVISGYLITAHLLGEISRTGTVALSQFWARRIRRLLPASLTVLAAVLIASLIWIPESSILQTLREIGASAVYVVNWVLAGDSVDYLASDNFLSPVQHYWSLAVEEQFYIVWPLLLVGAVVLAGPRKTARRRALSALPSRGSIIVVLSVIFVASFAFSVYFTIDSQPAAFFNTFARAWEFAAGGLVAAVAVLRAQPVSTQGRPPMALGIVATWVGLALIAVAALTFSDESPFPGSIALVPVVGAVLVILGGGVAGPGAPLGAMRLWPVQRIGDLSYGIYLWHWPIIVFFPFVVGRMYSVVEGLSIVLVSIVLALATKLVIEDPVRKHRWWAMRRWPAYSLAAGGAAILIAVSSVQSITIIDSTQLAAAAAQAKLERQPACFGAIAMDDGMQCPDKFDRDPEINLAFAASDLSLDWCPAPADGGWASCDRGVPDAPEKTIALVGDSHATALLPAFRDLITNEHWAIVSYLYPGCPGLSTLPIDMPERSLSEQEACADWSTWVLSDIASRDDISAVVFTSFSVRYSDPAVPVAGRLDSATVRATWQAFQDMGKDVAVVRDIPNTDRVDIPTCLGGTAATIDPCAFPRSSALIDDAVTSAATSLPSGASIDLSDYFCDAEICHALIGGVVVYADDNHVSRTYATTLAPFLEASLIAAFR